MNCLICTQNCVGLSEVLIIKGQGPLHSDCLRTLQFAQRQFRGLDIPALQDAELHVLLGLLDQELASRNTGSQKSA